MLKDKLELAKEFCIKHSKALFPVVIVAAVAVTVAVALSARGSRQVEDILPEETGSVSAEETAVSEEPMSLNEDDAISTLIKTYFNALATGDMETLQSVCDTVSEEELIRYQETSEYIDYYPSMEIYDKPGVNEGETIAFVYYKLVFTGHEEEWPGFQAFYVCTAEDGSLYLNMSSLSEETENYILAVSEQEDVVEFQNRVQAEYDEFLVQYPDLAGYDEEVLRQITVAVGEQIAANNAETTESSGESTEGESSAETTESETAESETQETTEGPVYATATTTVNVRKSDSEQSEKLGKISGGTQVQVLEQRVNGWDKVDYEGQEGYIKAEYLEVTASVESASDQETTGKVTALSNVNVRASASETANKLGMITGGDTAELISNEGDWCKINYNGQVGYVKTEYVEVE